ncbi:RNA polymerase sigma factor, partial [Zavarzinia sp.]|uniref:RNA polymerase sigma factor n=1 Tax=Zavarzinia sp. TaxID=2027920 RepID=UPI003BB73DFB
MSLSPLDAAERAAGGRIRAVLAARFRDLDLAEDAFADACLKAAESWPASPPLDAAAWLYRAAERAALDRLRKRQRRGRLQAEVPAAPIVAAPEDPMDPIPDERLRLIFVCCHPAIAVNARAALALRIVCGLDTASIARAYLLSEATLAQRLVRAKRKIAEAGISFEIPGPESWPERVEAVLSTLEIAYTMAYEDAAGGGPHADYAAGVLELAALLAEVMPDVADAHALAATVHYAEARRPARVDAEGMMVPLSEQDPRRWSRDLIARGEAHMARALALSRAR